MIKRNRHKISYRTSKKVAPKRKVRTDGRFSSKTKSNFSKKNYMPMHRWS
jgi:hypothetical protein